MAENKRYIEREWQVHDAGHFGKWFEDGPTVCAMNADGSCHPIICFSGPLDREEWEQVANLVAVAPKLYAACRRYLAQYDDQYHGVDKGELPRMMRAALAEVEGTING